MYNLAIDIGNTNSKLAIFNKRELIEYQSLKEITPETLTDLINKYDISSSTISSVAKEFEEVLDFLKGHTNYIQFSIEFNTGIQNYYKTLATLGLDRWAKIIAAHHYYPGKDCFIIDAGTCITYDLLTSQSEYLGGSISLGIHMRFEALHHFTGRLPLVEWDKEDTTIPSGIDTASAIRNGVLQGAVNEIEGFISHQNNNNNKGLKVLITGGDASFLLERLKNSIFAPQIIHDPYMVLKGLNEVIAFEYVQKD